MSEGQKESWTTETTFYQSGPSLVTTKRVSPIAAPLLEEACEESVEFKSIHLDDGDEDQEDPGDGAGEEKEKEVRRKGLRDPARPRDAVREEHELIHQPPRPCCKLCMRGRNQHDRHRIVDHLDDPAEAAVPTISSDYTFIGNMWIPAANNSDFCDVRSSDKNDRCVAGLSKKGPSIGWRLMLRSSSDHLDMPTSTL